MKIKLITSSIVLLTSFINAQEIPQVKEWELKEKQPVPENFIEENFSTPIELSTEDPFHMKRNPNIYEKKAAIKINNSRLNQIQRKLDSDRLSASKFVFIEPQTTESIIPVLEFKNGSKSAITNNTALLYVPKGVTETSVALKNFSGKQIDLSHPEVITIQVKEEDNNYSISKSKLRSLLKSNKIIIAVNSKNEMINKTPILK